MNLIKVSDIFEVRYGVNLELNKLELDPNGINFVSRTAKNNGVSAKVKLVPNVDPIEAGVITVAGGGSVMESFLQPEPFYSGRDLYFLRPKGDLSIQELLFYCACLRSNRYRFNYGRQANRTLAELKIPVRDAIPSWIKGYKVSLDSSIHLPLNQENLPLDVSAWKVFKYKELFDIERGRGPRKKELNGKGAHPFVSASEFNNGVTDFTDAKPYHGANVISVVRNGNSVANAFYQDTPFCSTEDVHIFKPKFELNKHIALFFCALIKKERYRFSYGRKWGIARMRESDIRLPVNQKGDPDFLFMENFIKTLPFSSQIGV